MSKRYTVRQVGLKQGDRRWVNWLGTPRIAKLKAKIDSPLDGDVWNCYIPHLGYDLAVGEQMFHRTEAEAMAQQEEFERAQGIHRGL